MPIVQISQRRHKTDALPCPAPRTDLRTQIVDATTVSMLRTKCSGAGNLPSRNRLDVSADRFKDGT